MAKAKNVVSLSAHEQAVSAIIAVGANKAEATKVGALIASALSALFADVNGSDEAFIAEFGNGENPKSKTFKAGALAEEIKAKIKHMKDAEKVKSILNTLKSRLSEARALRKAGGMPKDGENLQAALKRYKDAKPAADTKAKADTPEALSFEAFAKSASMEDVAELVSVWVAHHGGAAVGLASALADSLPISIKRNRKAA